MKLNRNHQTLSTLSHLRMNNIFNKKHPSDSVLVISEANLVAKNASGLLRGQYSRLLFIGFPQFGVSVDWISSAVTPRAAST